MVASVVDDELLFGLENFGVNHSEIPARIERTLELVGIADLRDREIATLSGGQKQKVAIAAILALEPDVLVLDEPTAALDPIAESQTYEQFDLLARGKTALYISHRLASTRFCDRILLLENGAVVEEGTHESLLKMGGRYAQLFETQARWYRDPPAGEEGAP